MKRDEKKAAILAECRARGWAPHDDNQADAAALWDLACVRLASPVIVNQGLAFNDKKRRGRGA